MHSTESPRQVLSDVNDVPDGFHQFLKPTGFRETKISNLTVQEGLTILLHGVSEWSTASQPEEDDPPHHQPEPASLELRLVVEVSDRWSAASDTWMLHGSSHLNLNTSIIIGFSLTLEFM